MENVCMYYPTNIYTVKLMITCNEMFGALGHLAKCVCT